MLPYASLKTKRDVVFEGFVHQEPYQSRHSLWIQRLPTLP